MAASIGSTPDAAAAGRVNPASCAQADSSEALLIVTAPGYSNLVVKCPCDGMSYALSPVLTNLDAVRIVLNWGERPYDLDSHIVFPGNHVYFSEMSGTDAQLDVDDVNGYGPETITLSPKREGWRYVYAVHDYNNRWLGAVILFANTILGRLIFLLIPTVMIFFYEPVTKFFRNISKEQ